MASAPLSRRSFGRAALALSAVALAGGACALAGRTVRSKLAQWTRVSSFARGPEKPLYDPQRDRQRLFVSQGKGPAANVDAVLDGFGLGNVIAGDDVVVVKVSAQWWNQGMTNVAAVRRLVERVLAVPGFRGEVIVFENTHFRLANGSGLSRAWTRASDRNVDVPGWTRLGDLVPHFERAGAPVSFVGLVDGGPSELAKEAWEDPSHEHGVYGGDGRGPIADGDARDGYHWKLEEPWRLRRSLVDDAQTPLTWPRFTSPRSGLVVDLRDGLFRREGGKLVKVDRRLRFVNMTTMNEHASTGMTGCCKSAMGIVDMSAGRLGTDPRVRDFQATHYFGHPVAMWRMAGPLGHFARAVRSPDLYVAVAEWVALTPKGVAPAVDVRLAAECALHAKTVVAGTDPVAIDAWCARNLLMPAGGQNHAFYDLDSEGSMLTKFLRYFREARGTGTMDPSLLDVA